jgi:hypothetical protein
MAHPNRAFDRRDGDAAHALTQGLGWFSIGLGVAELVAPGHLARFLGLEERTDLIRAYGAREIVTGVGILSEDPTPWMWGRVGGDLLDLGTLARGLGSDNPQRANVGLAVAAVAGVTALDLICARALGREEARLSLPVRDYSDRHGMPRPPAAMRGIARDLTIPADLRIPKAMRPYPELA